MKSHSKTLTRKEILRFIGIFSLIFLATFTFLYAFGLVPTELIDGSGDNSVTDDLKLRALQGADQATSMGETTTNTKAILPTYISIPKVDVDISVSNPTTTNNDVLDQYLTKGAVHYPGSGNVGTGNMLIFGHSSNWKVVKNQAYKALNGIENLVPGDPIYIKADDGTTYLYKVTSERLANADETLVDFSGNKNMLTLSTCDLFGEKQQRFVVTADFVGVSNQ